MLDSPALRAGAWSQARRRAPAPAADMAACAGVPHAHYGIMRASIGSADGCMSPPARSPIPAKCAYARPRRALTRARARTQLCVTCRIVRPLRAKHCAASDRCIEQFDHFCPWVGNAIGRRNRALFLAFLWLELGALGITAAVGALRLHAAARRPRPGSAVAWGAAFLVVDCFLALSVGALAVTQARPPPSARFEPVAPPARPPARPPIGP